MTFSEALKNLRTELKLNQKELAEIMHINATTLNRWELGKRMPTRAMGILLVNAAKENGASEVCIASLKETLNPERKIVEQANDLRYIGIDAINQLVNDSVNGIVVVGMENHDILYANDTAAEMTGHTIEEAKNIKCYQFLLHKNAPCSFCTSCNGGNEGFMKNEYSSERTGKHYVVGSKQVIWKGQRAQIKYITDITETNGVGCGNVGQLTDVAETAVYVADYETDELLYLNNAAKAVLHIEGAACPKQKCYEYLMNRTSSCPFCHKGVLSTKNYRADRIKYPANGREYRISSKILMWGERKVHVHYITDLTDFLNKAKELDELSDLLNEVPSGIGIYEIQDGVGSRIYINEAFYNLFGSKCENLTKYGEKNVILSAHPDDVPKIQEALNKISNGCDSMQLEYRLIGENGSWKWFHVTASVVERKDGCIKLYTSFFDCTESKQQQLQLIQNQQAVALAQNQGSLSIWTFNMDKKYLIQQTPIEADGQMGYPIRIENIPDCFIQSNSVHPDDIEKFLAAYKKLEDGASAVDETYRLIDQNKGTYDWVHMFYQRMDDNADGERMASGFSMIVNKQQEAIERYKLEQKLRERMYDDAVIFLEYNLMTGQYEGKNNLPEPYLKQQWQCPNEFDYHENMKANVEDEYLESLASKLYAKNLLKAFEHGETKVTCEYRSKERSGKPRTWYRVTVSMAKRPDTGDVMAFIYIEDIEKEKDRKLALESSLTDGIESIAIIHVADGQARFVRSNYNAPSDIGEYFTYDDTFMTRSHMIVIPEEQEFSRQSALLSTAVNMLEKENIYQYSVSMKDQNGKEKRHLFRFRYLDDRKTDIVLSVSDITSVYLEEQKQKKQLQNALTAVRQASSAKAEFYSRMSHDMRTPMNGILGMAELSEDETDFETLKANMKKVRESGQYLLNLVNDTLDLQRIESGKMVLEPKIVSTMNVVSNTLDMVGVTAKKKGINLKYSKGNADLNWYIRVDDLRLKQIFINLLSNAIKFTPAGGTVELEFKLLAREGMISHDVIYVRDTGIGMSEKFLKEGIFKPFSQEGNAVSSQYAGSGLGLSIAKSLVELMGGRIEVESELGVGTTFAVYIDFERVDEAEAKQMLHNQKEQTENVSTSLKGKKILLAEDHPLNAEIAKKLLQKVGCIVSWVKNGQEAVDCFAKEPVHAFDVILMDIRMPVMDGLTAAKQIRSLSKADAGTIPIIAMTANAYEEDIKASLDAGMNAHLGKPIAPKNLYETIFQYTQKGGRNG